MTPKERNKAKSTRLCYLAVLSAILVVLAGVFLVGKYGLPFGSQLGNFQREARNYPRTEQMGRAHRITGPAEFTQGLR